MLQLFLKHFIYETAIEKIFSSISENFPVDHDPVLVTAFSEDIIGRYVLILYHKEDDGTLFNLELSPTEYKIGYDEIGDEYYLESTTHPEYDFYDMESELITDYKIYI